MPVKAVPPTLWLGTASSICGTKPGTMFGAFAEHSAPSALIMFNAGFSFGEAGGFYRGEPLYHASLNASEYETLLASFGSR